MKYAIALAFIGLAAVPASAAGLRDTTCRNCAEPRVYDSRQVVKSVRTIDRSRVINTTSVVMMPPRVTAPRAPLYVGPTETVVNVVVHQYRTIHGPQMSEDALAQGVIVKGCNQPTRKARGRTCGVVLDVRG